MTGRVPCPVAPGPLEAYAARFDPLFGTLAQRRGFREYLQGLLLPRDRNKTLTALAGAEPVVAAQAGGVQLLLDPLLGADVDLVDDLNKQIDQAVGDFALAQPAQCRHQRGAERWRVRPQFIGCFCGGALAE